MRPFFLSFFLTRPRRLAIALTLVLAWLVWALGGAPSAPFIPEGLTASSSSQSASSAPAHPGEGKDSRWLSSIPMSEAQATAEVRSNGDNSGEMRSLEHQMMLAYQAAYDGQSTQAMVILDQILATEPAFRPALTLRGKIASEWARSGGESQKDLALAASRNATQALIEESRVRLQAQRLRHQRAQEVPSNLVMVSPAIQTVLAADIQEARLYVLKRNGDQFSLATDYYLSTGTAGAHKQIAGDQRTPVGIYSLRSRLKNSDLPALAGHGAWPLNFPNHWDHAQKRLGSGIWLHGSSPGQYDGLPHSTNGCLALSNDDLDELAPTLSDTGTILVLIAEHLNWVPPKVLAEERNRLLKRLSNDPIIYRGSEDASIYLYPAEEDVLLVRAHEGTEKLKEHFWSGDGNTRLAMDHS